MLQGQPTFIRKIRDSLVKVFDREFLIFLFFLFLSSVFWLVTVLNDTMEKEIDVPVALVNVPKDVVFTTPTSDTIRVTVRDKGFAIAGYLYGESVKRVEIDYRSLKRNADNITISNAELQKRVRKVLNSSTSIVQMKPEKLILYFSQGKSKRVPVRFVGSVQPAESYYLDPIRLSEDSVTIYGPDGLLKSVSFIPTVRTDISGVDKAKTVKVELAPPHGIKCLPSFIQLYLNADILVDGSVDVPVTAINMPEGLLLRTFPARVKVKYVVATSNYKNVTPEQFVVEADYNEIFANPDRKKCPLVLRQSPKEVMRPQLETTEVDYLIEK